MDNNSESVDYELDQELDSVINKDDSDERSPMERPESRTEPRERQNEEEEEELSPSRNEDDTDDNDSGREDDYNLSEDQRNAMLELEKLKAELGDYNDPPDYDFTERIKQLNEELAKEPDPEEKEARVGFKDELVDLVAPPPDYPEDDPDNLPPVDKINLDDETIEDNDIDKDTEDEDEKKKKQKVLVEKDGKFELVESDSVTADGLPIAVGSSSAENSNSNEFSGYDPTPPSQPRAQSATYSRPGSRGQRNNRAQSAQVRSSSSQDWSISSYYKSPYALSDHQKETLKQRQQIIAERKQKEEQRQREEKQEKDKDNEQAFQAWLKNKKKEIAEHKKQADSRKENNSQADDSSYSSSQEYDNTQENREAFEAWKKQKDSERKREISVQRQLEQEIESTYIVRERPECEKAFRQWLRRKRIQKHQEAVKEKQKARLYVLAARKCRKSQALARAIQQAQAFRYVDYYGYRY